MTDRFEYYKNYYKNNKHIILTKARIYGNNNKSKCLTYYSNVGFPSCNCCGINQINILTIDHINRINKTDDYRHRGVRLYTWLINNNYPDGFETLCHNCNSGKHYRQKCPHNLTIEELNKRLQTEYYKYTRIPTLIKFSDGDPKCVNCGETNILFLNIDHKNGGGKKQKKNKFNNMGGRYAAWLKNSAPTKDFQILCFNCNFLKHINS